MLKKCKNCNGEFDHTSSTRGLFCSMKCYWEYRRTNQTEYRKVKYVTLTCAHCGKQFERRDAEAKRTGMKFCSSQCAGTVSGGKASRTHPGKSYMKKCEWCGTEFKVLASKPRKFCCRKCNDMARSTMYGGENNPNYRHGQNQTSAGYTARKRYDSKCILCGFDVVVQIHHIVPKNEGGTNEPENLAVLCPNHHAMAHKGLISRDELSDAARRAIINTPSPLPADD